MLVVLRHLVEMCAQTVDLARGALGEVLCKLLLGYTRRELLLLLLLLLHRRLLGRKRRLLAANRLVSLRGDVVIHCQRLLVRRTNYWPI